MAGVRIENVEKSFGAVKVIRNVHIEAEDGEFVVLVGPSGCGKTTLLRMIAGLEDVTSGTISIDGRVVNELQPKDRDIATVYQNMAFGLIYRDHAKDEIRRRVENAAEILNIGDYLGRRPRELSGGQRQ